MINFLLYVASRNISQRCDEALNRLKDIRAGLIADRRVDRKKKVGNALKDAFHFGGRKRARTSESKAGASKRPRGSSWTHRFVCLAVCEQDIVPTTDREKDILLEAGLGEKKLVIDNVECSAEEFREALYQEFPKLRDGGGFQFFKCRQNSRVLEPLSAMCLTSPKVLRDRAGNARTYICPMQRDLELTPIHQACSVVGLLHNRF